MGKERMFYPAQHYFGKLKCLIAIEFAWAFEESLVFFIKKVEDIIAQRPLNYRRPHFLPTLNQLSIDPFVTWSLFSMVSAAMIIDLSRHALNGLRL